MPLNLSRALRTLVAALVAFALPGVNPAPLASADAPIVCDDTLLTCPVPGSLKWTTPVPATPPGFTFGRDLALADECFPVALATEATPIDFPEIVLYPFTCLGTGLVESRWAGNANLPYGVQGHSLAVSAGAGTDRVFVTGTAYDGVAQMQKGLLVAFETADVLVGAAPPACYALVGSDPNANTHLTGVAASPTGGAFVTGRVDEALYLAEFDAQCNLLWETFNGDKWALALAAVDNPGANVVHLYVGGQTATGPLERYVAAFDAPYGAPAMPLAWDHSWPMGQIFDIAATPSSVYAVGHDSAGSAFVARFTPWGLLAWENLGTFANGGLAYGVSIAANDEAYVTGSTDQMPSGESELFVARYAPGGPAPTWAATLQDAGAIFPDAGAAVATAASDGPIVVGAYNGLSQLMRWCAP